jgi:PTH1 family peptidyl-tRNA hydrolase
VDAVARKYSAQFHHDSKYKSDVARCGIDGQDCRLQKPMDFMNCSGAPVAALAGFYRIPRNAILVVHDDLDLEPGVVRLKQGGGHGGHNGLRDLIPSLGGNDFQRLRIGIGHPGHRDEVTGHVLKPATHEDRDAIDSAIELALQVLPDIIAGNADKAMQELHTAR